MRALKVIGKVLLVITSVILCVVLFFSTLVTMLVADVKVATNKDNLQNLLKQTLSAPAYPSSLSPMAAAAGADIEFDLSGGDISGALVEYAYATLQDAAGGEMPITLEQVQEFVERSTLKEFISEMSASIISDIYSGESTTNLSSEEIEKLLTENKDVIKEFFDIELTDEAIQQINQAISEIPVIQQIREEGVASVILGGSNAVAPDEEQGNAGTAPDWVAKLPGFGTYVEAGGASNIFTNPVALALELVRFYTSDSILLLCIGVCAALIGLLFLCAWSKPYKAMNKSGITLFVAGGIFLIPTMIAWLSPATWLELFSSVPMVGPVSRFILMLTGGVCGGVAGLGAALIAGGIVVKIQMRKKAALAAAEAEAIAEAPAEEVAPEEGAEEAAAEEATAEEAPVEETPAGEAPVAEAAAEETPAEEAPTEETV